VCTCVGVIGQLLLGRQDSNLRVSAPKADALPLGYAPPKLPSLLQNAVVSKYTIAANVSQINKIGRRICILSIDFNGSGAARGYGTVSL
jgi:hypothetical protein